ncbi:hypothetical protein ACFL67_03750 [candidate division KSB1 bacterium]
MNINSFAAMNIGEKLQTFNYVPEKSGSYDVEIKIDKCGICHSDMYMIDNRHSESPGNKARY